MSNAVVRGGGGAVITVMSTESKSKFAPLGTIYDFAGTEAPPGFIELRHGEPIPEERP